ncbi:hypothetical protein DYB32_003451 [Aphanomyces invadans]|uniref:Uncharacterized protein n=1 Tax=Aphanomyces invadans TaxID=157072 RepID=A0A418B0Q3_9STRA|nr:hypothetical protein DYB32_003451 [Aphanomyces invadans]
MLDRSCASLLIHQHESSLNPLFSVSNKSLTMQHPPRKVKSAANLAPSIPRIPSFKGVATKRNVSSGSLPNANSYSVTSEASALSSAHPESSAGVPQALIHASSFENSMSAEQLKNMLDDPTTTSSSLCLAGEEMRPQTFGFNQQVFTFLAQTYELHGPSFHAICAHNARAAAVAGCMHLSKTWIILEILYEKRTNATSHKELAPPSNGTTEAQQGGPAHGNQTSTLLAQLDEVNPMHVTMPRHPFHDEERRRELMVASPKSQTYGKSADVSRIQDILLKELLEYYSEAGDVQSCTTISAAMSYVTSIETLMGKGWLQQVYMHYIGAPPTLHGSSALCWLTRRYDADLLHQLQLYSVANDMVKNCPDVGIKQMNMVLLRLPKGRVVVHLVKQKATTIYTSCSKCTKAIEALPPKIAKVAKKALCSNCFNVTVCALWYVASVCDFRIIACVTAPPTRHSRKSRPAMSGRHVMEQVVQKVRNERDRLDAQKEAEKIASRDYARSVIKLVALESAETKALKKTTMLHEAKAKRDAASRPLKDRLKELVPEEKMVVAPPRVPGKQLSTAEYKANMDSIRRIWGNRKSMLDPLRADLEVRDVLDLTRPILFQVGKLCQAIGEEAKAVKHFMKAVGPYVKKKNLVVEPTQDEWQQIKHSEHARV